MRGAAQALHGQHIADGAAENKAQVLIKAAFTSRPAETQAKGRMSALAGRPGRPHGETTARASQISKAPQIPSTTAQTQGRKLGPTPP
jgi:hypothetical protein